MARSVVIVGGGIGGLRCVETLRREGFDGSIALVRGESLLPYERPPLSKQVLTGERSVESLVYRGAEYFAGLDIDAVEGPATDLDLAAKAVRAGSEVLHYDSLVICTGAVPRRLPASVVPPSLSGVYYLRTADDAARLAAGLRQAQNVVVVGAGFIGSEVASSARKLDRSVTIVETSSSPLARVLGPEMADECLRLHHSNGTELLCGRGVTAIRGEGHVESVELSDGVSLAADLVVVGIGAEPAVEWLVESGLSLGDGVHCDDRLRASSDGVYAVGDLASLSDPLTGRRKRFEQWTVAVEQAKYVARQIAQPSKDIGSFESSNYFWSEQYGVNLQFVGATVTDDVTTVSVNRSGGRLFALYRSGERLGAAFAMDAPRELMRAKRLIEARQTWDVAMAEFSALQFEEMPTRHVLHGAGN